MFDLKIRETTELASVPIPLPGRVMLFVGPGGVMMVRDSSGTITAMGAIGPVTTTTGPAD